jgi:glycosyl transferase family 25
MDILILTLVLLAFVFIFTKVFHHLSKKKCKHEFKKARELRKLRELSTINENNKYITTITPTFEDKQIISNINSFVTTNTPIPAIRKDMEIYVISLKHQPERREKVDKLMKGIKYSYFDGVYGKTINDEEKAILNKYVKKHKLNDHQVGCFLSHLKIWEQLINNNKSDVNEYLIFEDDISIKNNIDNIYNYVNNITKDVNYDTIFIGHCAESEGELLRQISKNDYNVTVRKSVFPRCLHAYIISKTGAAKLIRYFQENISVLPIDEVIAIAISKGVIKSYSIFPAGFDQPWQ